MQLSKKQNEYIVNATHRWNIKSGAVRSGKSYVDTAFVIPFRIRERAGKPGLNVILGVSKESIERNVLQPMREIYTDKLIGTINSRNVARICGEDVYCLGAEKVSQVAKIQGASIKYCYGDEIAKWNKEVFQMLKSRLDKPYSCFDGSCNPEHPTHWLKEFLDTPDLDIYLQKYTIFDNPYLDADFVTQLCKEYEGTIYYDRLILGFHSLDSRHIGTECSLAFVEEWADTNPGPVTYPGMDRMDFGYYRNPIKNDVDGSFCGISIFDAAKDLIRKADIQAARLDWEYESGERAVHVDERALKKKNGRAAGMEHLNRRLYRGLNLEDGKDKELLREYSPGMRDGSYLAGLEKYYRSIEFTVGLAYGDLSDVQEVSKTATEVKASKARKYNRVAAIQNNLRNCLEDYAAGLAFYNSAYRSGYEFSCKFHDSILTDEETERQQDRQEVSMGAMSLLEYRMKWYDEDEETAKKNLPIQNTVMEE